VLIKEIMMIMCLLVTAMSCAERAGPIEMPFGAWTRVGPRNNKFGKGPDPLGGGSGNVGPHAYADDHRSTGSVALLRPPDILILAFLVYNPGDLYYLG